MQRYPPKPAVVAGLALLLLIVWYLSNARDSQSAPGRPEIRHNDASIASPKSGHVVLGAGPPRTPYTRRKYTDVQVEILHARPDADPKALILCFHGCTHTGSDWFTLPEEGIIVRQAIAKGLAVLAITSYDRQSGCWSDVDLERLPPALKAFESAHPWSANLPRFAIGASSGAFFATSIPSAISLKGVYAQIGRPDLDALKDWVKPHPKVMHLLYMPRDSQLKGAFEFFQSELKSEGVDSRVVVLESTPCAVNAKRLAERVYDLTPELASDIVDDLVKRQIIDRDSKVPKHPTIRALIYAQLPTKEMFYAVQEEVQVCFAQHELTSEHYDRVLQDWIALLS